MPQGKHRDGYKRPGVGRKRRQRHPTAIQKLGTAQSSKIRGFVADARAGKCTCSDRKPHFHTWAELTAAANGHFKLALSEKAYRTDNDVFVEQVQEEARAEREMDREWAAAIAGTPFEKLPEAVREELSGEVFRLRRSKPGTAEYRKALEGLGWLLSDLRRSDVQAQKLALEREKLEARKQMHEATSPREVYLAATEELLKRLRTRKEVRAVLDPIQKDLVEELSKSAESFTKRVEAQQAG